MKDDLKEEKENNVNTDAEKEEKKTRKSGFSKVKAKFGKKKENKKGKESENGKSSGKFRIGKRAANEDKCGEFFAGRERDSGKALKGTTKTFYFRLFLSFFVVILLSILLMVMLVYVFRTEDLAVRFDKIIAANAQSFRDVVAMAGEHYGKDLITEEFVRELADNMFTEDYQYSFYSDFDEMNSQESLSLTVKDKTLLDFGRILCSHHKTVAKAGGFYIVIKINSMSSTDLGRLWYDIIWMAACATLILALLFNTFATSWAVRPIKKLSNAMQEVSKGNFDIKIDVDGSDEIASLQKTFNMMTEGLKKNEEESKEFVATLSHEYKTPITAISGYADLLQRSDLTEEERREYLSVICEQAKRLSNLSTEMLQLARLDSNVAGLEKEEFSLDEQVRTAVLALEPMWAAKNTDLDIDLDEVTIFANKSMLSHVWENLISNAVKFTPEGGKIVISLKNGADSVRFEVRDSGCGISPEALPKIFDRFYKSKAPENAGGNGLGLAITKRIVDMSGGTVSAASEVGKGTTMTVILPKK